MSGPKPRPVSERFWPKVDKTADCWNWKGHKNPNGYGRFSVSSRTVKLAHRLAYEMDKGPIPDGLVIDHICRNPSCVRPDHLRAILQHENMQNLGGQASNNTSGHRGVYWDKGTKKWHASVGHKRKRYHVGLFDSIEDAAEAVRAKRLELHTHNELDRAA